MKNKFLNFVIALVLVFTVLGASTGDVKASSPQATQHSIFPGAVVCGTLHGWGVWRDTASIGMISRTVYFEPSRVGTHQLKFYAYGYWPEGTMKPYWSNDGGRTWKSWSWSSGGHPSGYYKDNTVTLYLRTDTTKTIYKFVFYSGTSSKKYIHYRFYCQ